jgi:hypothetical protein
VQSSPDEACVKKCTFWGIVRWFALPNPYHRFLNLTQDLISGFQSLGRPTVLLTSSRIPILLLVQTLMPTELLHISDNCYVIWTSPCSFSTHPQFSAFCPQCLSTHLPRLPLTLTNASLKYFRHSSLPPMTVVPQQGGILALFHCSS